MPLHTAARCSISSSPHVYAERVVLSSGKKNDWSSKPNSDAIPHPSDLHTSLSTDTLTITAPLCSRPFCGDLLRQALYIARMSQAHVAVGNSASSSGKCATTSLYPQCLQVSSKESCSIQNCKIQPEHGEVLCCPVHLYHHHIPLWFRKSVSRSSTSPLSSCSIRLSRLPSVTTR
jgi:hypothetical protein